MTTRRSGILMPVFSLANDYGIGSLGQEAYAFVDFLKRSNQTLWQVLPLGMTSFGDSPYQSFSSYAGNTQLISLETLVKDNLLLQEELDNSFLGDNPESVDYACLFDTKNQLLKKAVERFKLDYQKQQSFEIFCKQNSFWLDDYALYMATKRHFNWQSWTQWEDEGIKHRHAQAILIYSQLLSEDIFFYQVTQFLFFEQWHALKLYANEKGIDIIGDMPIYVALDSVDVWVNREYFKTDEMGQPTVVAGCPPDAFSQTGQLWGNPIYNWDKLEQTQFKWWIDRLAFNEQLYDIIRIDHFRAFESFWEIPADSQTAVNGEWVKGPGMAFFNALYAALPNIRIIAEDLGTITPEVVELRQSAKLPGMAVLQFAFDHQSDSTYLPHHIKSDMIAYTGTHDNNTARGWYEDDASQEDRDFFDAYAHRPFEETIGFAMTRLAFASTAQIAITTMQDLLDLGTFSRINLPSTLGGNWCWRMRDSHISEAISEYLVKISKIYRRNCMI